VSVIGLIVLCVREYFILKTNCLEKFYAVCTDQSLLEMIIGSSKKKIFTFLIKEGVIWSYVVYCVINLFYQIGLWQWDIWIGLGILGLLILIRQMTYVLAKFIVRKANELHI
jgi:hypothetical protein